MTTKTNEIQTVDDLALKNLSGGGYVSWGWLACGALLGVPGIAAFGVLKLNENRS